MYDDFKKAVKKKVGVFKTESLECCIHFVSTFTFAAVKILKDKVRVHFSLGRKQKSNRMHDCIKTSAGRFLYSVDISSDEEINSTLLKWIGQAFERKPKKAEPV